MRLLFVCPDMRTGGAERHWATLVPALRERGVEVGLVCLASEGAFFGELVARGVPSVCLHMRGRFDGRGLRRALGFARPHPDAVVTRGVSGQLVGQAIARRAGASHVLNEHTPLTPAGRLVPPRPHQRVLTRLVAPRVDAVIAVTSRQVVPLAALGYRRERIEVVENGVFAGTGLAPGAAGGDREPSAPGGGEFTALCVAGLRPEKGVDVFIRAIAAARRENPAVKGLVAGEGPERERLAREADGSGVELLGARADMPDLMLAADVVVLTSEAEALPMSILEAMSLARPVVSTDVGGVREAVVDGETGFVTAPGDAHGAARALLALAADPQRARRMGEAGRERQRERFDGDSMVDGYLAALERIVAAA